MNTITLPLAIYPSQLKDFNSQAKKLAEAIEHHFRIKSISAFVRNDCISIGFGYKGHSDLVESAKFRTFSDTHEPFNLFDNVLYIDAIAEAFASKVVGLSKAVVVDLFAEITTDVMTEKPASIYMSLGDLINALPKHQKMHLQRGAITRALLSGYHEAWIALKDQARIALNMDGGKSHSSKSELMKIHVRLHARKKQVLEIIRMFEQKKNPLRI